MQSEILTQFWVFKVGMSKHVDVPTAHFYIFILHHSHNPKCVTLIVCEQNINIGILSVGGIGKSMS